MLQCERLNMKPAYLKATTPSNIISGWMNGHYRAAFLALVTRYKIIINNTINFFLKTAASILLILNHYSLRATLLLLTLPDIHRLKKFTHRLTMRRCREALRSAKALQTSHVPTS